MFTALISIACISQVILIFSVIRLLFRSQRPSAKKWLAFSGIAMSVSIFAAGFISIHEGNREAVALGFVDSSDRQRAKAEGISDATVWGSRKIELDAAATKQREDDKREAEAKQKAAADKKAADEKLAAWKEQNCDRDVGCIGERKKVLANTYCQAPVESLAKYQAEWTNGWELRFPYYRWKSQPAGVVTYYGSAVKFQNGFGAWQNMVYECDYDVRNDRPLDARAEAGRLR
jgi:hypothetical protein